MKVNEIIIELQSVAKLEALEHGVLEGSLHDSKDKNISRKLKSLQQVHTIVMNSVTDNDNCSENEATRGTAAVSTRSINYPAKQRTITSKSTAHGKIFHQQIFIS